MGTAYEQDVVAWASEQAQLLRSGQISKIDVEHIAQEIEDVGKSEQRELASRLAVLLSHLLKWQYQPDRRGASWEKTIKAQRKEILYALDESPSLTPKLAEARWLDMVWAKAVAQAVAETELDCFPEAMQWPISDVMSPEFFPDESKPHRHRG